MTQSTDLLYQNKRARSYDIETIGFRYHMANLHAAIGMTQIAKMKVISESRQNACHHYTGDYRAWLRSISRHRIWSTGCRSCTMSACRQTNAMT